MDRAFLEAVVETTAAYVVKTTLEGKFLFVNHMRPDSGMQVIGKAYLTDFVDEASRPGVASCLRQVATTGKASFFECTTFGYARENERYHCTVGPVVENNEVVALVIIAHDVTQAWRMAEHQRQTQKMEAVGQLAAGVAHNFNNTLQGIVGNVELARMQAPDAIRLYLENALSACADASRLVKDLLLFAGRHARPGRELVSLEVCIERVMSMCRVTFDRLITIKLERRSAVLPILIHTNEVEHAVFNLLLNARDAVANQPRPEITVELESLPSGSPEVAALSGPNESGPYVAIRVRDNGIGMPEDVRTRAFEPFFTTKTAGLGTGLGLATVLACARQHNGWAACESAPGRGAVVSLYIPYTDPRSARERTPSPAPPVAPAGPPVLVVDDDDIVRDSVARVLRFGGFVSFTAPNGVAALQFVERSNPRPALVLLDESMPGLDGAAVRKRLTELAPDVKVVIISGLGASDFDTEGAAAVLEKPVRADALLETVRQVLGIVRTPS